MTRTRIATPVEVAKSLGVSPETFRVGLRSEARRGNPLAKAHIRYERWQFTAFRRPGTRPSVSGVPLDPPPLTPSAGLASLIEHTFGKEAGMLTPRQRQIWDFLVDYVDGHGYPPTVREIGEAVGLASPSTVHAHLANLERAGLLRRDPTKPRALELTGRAKTADTVAGELTKLPLLGQIAAGGPLLAEQNVEDEIAVPENLRGDFLLRIKGDSMIEAGILDGDVVVVRRARDARDGEIVVALAGDDETADEATVKRFFRESGRIRLQPENSALDPIFAPHVQVLGKVVGVFREL